MNSFSKLRHHLLCHSNPQIKHNLFRSPRYSQCLYLSISLFNSSSLSTFSIPKSTKNLDSFSGNVISWGRNISFKEGNLSSQKIINLFFGHMVKVIDNSFHHSLRWFSQSDHIGNLKSYDWMVNKSFSESFSFVCKNHALLNRISYWNYSTHTNLKPFVIKIAHHVFKTFSFVSDQIFYWDFYVFENYKSRTRTICSLSLYFS